MQKSILERLITKYNLAGACEIVEFVVANGVLSVKCLAENRHAFVVVSTDKVEIPDGSYTIIETAQLRSLLGVLGDEITIKVIKHIDELIALEFRDSVTKVRFALGDSIMLPKLPKVNVQAVEFGFILDESFTTTFVRAKGALADAENFAVVLEGDKLNVVIGYSENQNTNQVTIGVSPSHITPFEPLFYNAKMFREILMANREASGGSVNVDSNGLAHISFDLEGFTVDYYLSPTDNV